MITFFYADGRCKSFGQFYQSSSRTGMYPFGGGTDVIFCYHTFISCKYAVMACELSISLTRLCTSLADEILLLIMMFLICGIAVALIENSVSPIPNNSSVAFGSEASSPH